MQEIRVSSLLPSGVILMAAICFGQSSDLPSRRIDLKRSMSAPGFPKLAVPGEFTVCSPDGTIFTPAVVLADPEGVLFPDIYSITEQQVVHLIHLPTPVGLEHPGFGSLYPGTRQVVELIAAHVPPDPATPNRLGKLAFSLSVANRDGTEAHNIRLDLPFEPAQAAVFDSGEFLVLGADFTRFEAVMAVLNADGSVKRTIDFGVKDWVAGVNLDYLNPERLKKIGRYPATESALEGVRHAIRWKLLDAQFVPRGGSIAMVQRNSTLPIYRFREGEQQPSISLKLPEGAHLMGLLGSKEDDSLVALIQAKGALEKDARGKAVFNDPKSHLIEVDASTGEIVSNLSIEGISAEAASCAANGRLSSLFAKEDADGLPYVRYASALR